MRVTSDIFVSALLRRVFSAGGYAAITRRGAAEAGAVFLVVRGRDGRLTLFGPAPQSDYGRERPSDRSFVILAEVIDDAALNERVAKEERFDSDVWFVEIETTGPVEDLVDVIRR